MNQTQAIAKLRKLLGPKFAYRVDPKAPTAEQREANRIAFRAAKLVADQAEEDRLARMKELLQQDEAYQALKTAAKDAKAAQERIGSTYHKRITVGVSNSLFFSVSADGDNWEEVIDAVATKEKTTA